jgi:hypothetical protein
MPVDGVTIAGPIQGIGRKEWKALILPIAANHYKNKY